MHAKPISTNITWGRVVHIYAPRVKLMKATKCLVDSSQGVLVSRQSCLVGESFVCVLVELEVSRPHSTFWHM